MVYGNDGGCLFFKAQQLLPSEVCTSSIGEGPAALLHRETREDCQGERGCRSWCRADSNESWWKVQFCIFTRFHVDGRFGYPHPCPAWSQASSWLKTRMENGKTLTNQLSYITGLSQHLVRVFQPQQVSTYHNPSTWSTLKTGRLEWFMTSSQTLYQWSSTDPGQERHT